MFIDFVVSNLNVCIAVVAVLVIVFICFLGFASSRGEEIRAETTKGRKKMAKEKEEKTPKSLPKYLMYSGVGRNWTKPDRVADSLEELFPNFLVSVNESDSMDDAKIIINTETLELVESRREDY